MNYTVPTFALIACLMVFPIFVFENIRSMIRHKREHLAYRCVNALVDWSLPTGVALMMMYIALDCHFLNLGAYHHLGKILSYSAVPILAWSLANLKSWTLSKYYRPTPL